MKSCVSIVAFALCFSQAAIAVAQQLAIKGQRELKIKQGESITLSLDDITVEADRALNYPNGFYLLIDDGSNYDVNGNTITPMSSFHGNLKVDIRVSNGNRTSDRFELKIKVEKAEGDDDDDDDEPTNAKPIIVSQVAVEINKGQSFKIELVHLVVSDSDNNYPSDFTIKVEPGSNYTVSGTTVTPASNFTGNLIVKVKVNDGTIDSDVFDFKITVKQVADPNVKPVITTQSTLSTFKNEPFTIRLADLSVTDPDDAYPTGFTLTVLPGSNYAVSGATVTPSTNFLGSLTIKVKVNDGTDDSNLFDLIVTVVERGTLQILSQSVINVLEDSSYAFKLSDLNVSDPLDSYPSGFSIVLLPGDNYTVEGAVVFPNSNYNGNLKVPVTVSKGATSSNVYEALVVVMPVNDPPLFSEFDDSPISISAQVSELKIASEVKTADIDNELLAFAEIQIDTGSSKTFLAYENTENVRGVFDQSKGTLIFIGEGAMAEYDQALQSVSFSSSDSLRTTTTISFRLNDGNSYSEAYVKTIINEGSHFGIEIPSAFTPNNDNANDRWVISLLQSSASAKIELRIYNDKGLLLFESDSFDKAWDGTFEGELMAAGSYFFTMVVSDTTKRTRKRGVVTLLR
jgi:gliding motility-associated-like protein